MLMEGFPPDGVVDVAAVDQRRVGVPLVGGPTELHRRELLVVRRSARHDRRQRQEVPVQHRKILHLLVGHDRGRLRLRQFHERRFRRDGHDFLDSREIENEVRPGLIAHEELDFAPLRGKTGEFRRDLVDPRLESNRSERTRRAGSERLRETGPRVQDRHRCARQRSSRAIGHRARDVPAHDLSRGRTGDQNEGSGAQERHEWRGAKP